MRRWLFLVPVTLWLLSGCDLPSDGGRASGMPAEIKAADDALQRGDVAQATRLFEDAIRKHPRDRATYVAIVSVCQDRKQWPLMARFAELGAAATSASDARWKANFYNTAGEAYDRMGRFADMMRVAEAAYKAMPDDPQTLNALGYAYAEAGTKLDDAIRLTTRAVELGRDRGLTPEQLGAIVDSLGWAYYKAGRIADATATLATAANMSPGQVEIHYHLALAYRAQGRNEDARIELMRALAIEPGNQVVQQLLKQLGGGDTAAG
ncbi:MAG: tetratricopeptide repeat protein [Chthonomonadales bacterium]